MKRLKTPSEIVFPRQFFSIINDILKNISLSDLNIVAYNFENVDKILDCVINKNEEKLKYEYLKIISNVYNTTLRIKFNEKIKTLDKSKHQEYFVLYSQAQTEIENKHIREILTFNWYIDLLIKEFDTTSYVNIVYKLKPKTSFSLINTHYNCYLVDIFKFLNVNPLLYKIYFNDLLLKNNEKIYREFHDYKDRETYEIVDIHELIKLLKMENISSTENYQLMVYAKCSLQTLIDIKKKRELILFPKNSIVAFVNKVTGICLPFNCIRTISTLWVKYYQIEIEEIPAYKKFVNDKIKESTNIQENIPFITL
jgi:hypothetical protein